MDDLSYTIFYSWQSDLPNSVTRGIIESSIEAAVKSLINTAAVLADRYTKGVTGSPDIVQTIFSKIDECDVFVADDIPHNYYDDNGLFHCNLIDFLLGDVDVFLQFKRTKIVPLILRRNNQMSKTALNDDFRAVLL